jgi:hypothetical protein
MNALPIVTDFLRTDESCFSHVPDFPYTPHYLEVGGLRVAYIDEGPRDAPAVLLMHGEPTWSFLYRKMIPVLLAAGDTLTTPRGAARAFRATSSEGAMVFVVRGGEETAPARFLAGKAA